MNRFLFRSGGTIVAFAVAFAFSYFGYFSLPEVSVRWKINDKYTPTRAVVGGPQMEMVYIGSSSCKYCNLEYMPSVIRRTKAVLQKKAKQRGWSFSVKGVAVDWAFEDGVQHLREMGRFDEVVAGRSWYNMGSKKYFWGELAGKPSTPQVLVVFKHLISPRPDSTLVFKHENETLLVRKIGALEIRDWLRQGAPMPIGGEGT